MKNNFTTEDLQSDWERLRAMEDDDIDTSEIPEITAEQAARAVLRVGGKPVEKGKVRVNIYLDAEIIAYYKSLAGGRGYQTLINETLKQNIRHQDLESTIRRVLREELKAIV